MRLSVKKDDGVGYINYIQYYCSKKLSVYVDGKPCKNVIAFDDQEGWVEFLLTDSDGNFYTSGDEAACLRVTGNVTWKEN